MILSECHREVRKQRAKPVLGRIMAIWELSISHVPILYCGMFARALEAKGIVGKRPETDDAGKKGRRTCQTELALTCKLWA